MKSVSEFSGNGISEPSASDLDNMLAIFKSGQGYHHELFPEIFCTPDNEPEIKNYLASFLKPRNPFRKRRRFALAWFEANELKGYLLYQLQISSDIFFGQNQWMCHIEDIAVDENSRKKGIASSLLSHLMETLNGLGKGLVSAQVWRENTGSEILFEKYKFDDASKQFYYVLK